MALNFAPYQTKPERIHLHTDLVQKRSERVKGNAKKKQKKTAGILRLARARVHVDRSTAARTGAALAS